MTDEPIFEHAAHLLNGKFTTDPTDRENGRMTGYAAVKKSFGMHPDDPAIAHNGSCWADLDVDVRRAFKVLDRIVSERVGHRTQFSVWSSTEERTSTEVRDVLIGAEREEPNRVMPQPAMLRPSTAGMPGQRKTRWVICNQLGTIAVAQSCQIADVIRILSSVAVRTDIEIVVRLDSLLDEGPAVREPAPKTMVHLELARVWGELLRHRATSFNDLVHAVGSDCSWGFANDDDLAAALAELKASLVTTPNSQEILLA